MPCMRRAAVSNDLCTTTRLTASGLLLERAKIIFLPIGMCPMPIMFLVLVTTTFFAVNAAAPASALDEYRVIGVAANDSLNMRENVEGAAEGAESVYNVPITGTIPWNGTGILATGVTVTVGSSLWREVHFGGLSGWVNARFLQQVRRRFDDMPEDMDCGGTEPFWSLKIRGDQAVYEHETSISYSVAAREPPANRGIKLWAITLIRQGPRAERIVLVREEACDDGMSLHDFSYSAMILGTKPEIYNLGPYMGCCSMPR